VRARIKWRAHGDRGFKEFFDAVRMHPTQTSITELLDATGTTQTS
jgi:hypothetical protein